MNLQEIHELFSQALQPQMIGQITRQGYAAMDRALLYLEKYAKEEQKPKPQITESQEHPLDNHEVD